MKTPRCNATAFGVTFLLISSLFGSAGAQAYRMSFEVTGFGPSNGNSPPNDPVTGSIVWEADGINSPVQTFDSINLSLDGHSYSIGELSYYRESSAPYNFIGTARDGANIVSSGHDEFSLGWNYDSLQPFDFEYASSQRSGIWDTYVVYNPESFISFTIASIPEPSPVALFTLFVLGVWLRHKGSKRKFGTLGEAYGA